MALPSGPSEVHRPAGADSRHHRAHVHTALSPHPFFALRYIVFASLLIGACASYSSTARITPSLLLQLAIVWSWVPLVQFLIARVVAGRRGDLMLIATHRPWSLWLIAASAMTGTFGYAAYGWMLLLALVPMAVTPWLILRFFVDVRGDDRRAAIRRTLAQQAITWLVAAIYLDRAVSLWPRIIGWLS